MDGVKYTPPPAWFARGINIDKPHESKPCWSRLFKPRGGGEQVVIFSSRHMSVPPRIVRYFKQWKLTSNQTKYLSILTAGELKFWLVKELIPRWVAWSWLFGYISTPCQLKVDNNQRLGVCAIQKVPEQDQTFSACHVHSWSRRVNPWLALGSGATSKSQMGVELKIFEMICQLRIQLC